MRVFITGAGGQVGHELVTAFGHHEVTAVDHAILDVADRGGVLAAIADARPHVIVHAAAWTAVDACEGDPERARLVNTEGTVNVVDAARAVDARVVYFSTDYVFDGEKAEPYVETDAPNPKSEYGRSKLGGELALGPDDTIVRISWVCGRHGNNMVKTILRLASEHDTLQFVDDQRGHPTFADDAAGMVSRLVDEGQTGILHVTNQGAVSWFEFARSVLQTAGLDPSRVSPIATADLVPARPAPRPANSVLDNAALRDAGIPLLPDFHEPLDRLVREFDRFVTRVRVVVVNYNGGDLTVDCLRSLVATRWRADRLEIVLVDNASTDDVVARVHAELPVVTVIESATNLGFGGGCNLGMRERAGVDYVALVNNDATVDPEWLAPLVDALEQDSSLGAACPKVLYAGSDLIDNVGVEQGKWGRGADRGHLEPDRGQYDAPADVFGWCGAAVLLRASYLDTVGEFDERLFLYCEDLELSWRGRAFRWHYRTVPESVVRHVHGATSVADSPLQRFYNLRNALLVALRHASLLTALAATGRSLAAIPYAAIRHPHDLPTRARAFGGFLRLAPVMLGARAHDRREARHYSRRPMEERAAYTGIDNLEVMSSAVKFARYMRDIIAAAAGPVAAKPRVLDFGAGTGTIAERVTELGYDVTCLEPDASLRALLGELRLPTVADPDAAAALAPFDVIYAINVLEHIDDDVAALSQLRSLLRPGGKLVIFVPAFPMLYSEMDRRIGHFRRYRLRALGSVVSRAGYAVDRASYVDSLGFFGSLVYKWLFSREGKISEWMVGTYDRYVFPVSTTFDPFVGRLLGRNAIVLAHRD